VKYLQRVDGTHSPGQVPLTRKEGAEVTREREFELLQERITVCRACPRLVTWREEVARTKRASFRDEAYWGRPVPGFGDPEARLLVVGLAPAAHGANRTGRMFTGDRSGEWLYRALHRAGFASQPEATFRADGLRLQGVFITAIVRCAPPANRPSQDERSNCRPFLEAELEHFLPQASCIVALGGLAFDQVVRVLRDRGLPVPRPRPRFGHAVEVEIGSRLRFLGSYHPSQQNTFTGTLTEEAFDAVWARAREILGEPDPGGTPA
jgi:uracil-DNA glycosylase